MRLFSNPIPWIVAVLTAPSVLSPLLLITAVLSTLAIADYTVALWRARTSEASIA